MRAALALLAVTMAATAAHAQATETRDGQVVCGEIDAMREFIQAIAAADRQWRDQVKGCVLSTPGSKLAILDRDVPAGGIPHVARVRIFRRDGNASVIGYAILEPGQ